MDLSQRRVTEFDPDRVKIMNDFIKNNSSKFKSDKLIFLDKCLCLKEEIETAHGFQ